MEEKIKKKYTDDVISELLKRFNLKRTDVELVGSHQSFVYKGIVNEKNVYVKMIISTHRSLSQIQAEIEMIQYLDKNNFSVATAMPSINGDYIEAYSDNGTDFFAVMYKEAEGLGIGEYPWSLDVPKRVGVMNAELHNLLSTFKPSECVRPEWWENTFLADAHEYLPGDHDRVLEVIDDLLSTIKKLPKDAESYGLIHGDMLACNYNMTDKNITLFDFDESSYCWYVNDFAVSLFYDALGYTGIVDVSDAIESFKSYLSGYRTVRNLDAFWISKLDLFLKLREIILYVAICRSRDLNDLDRWTENFISGRKEKIENNVPFLDVEFENYI